MGNYTKWYRVGNVKLVQSSKEVEGTDTYWLTAGLNPGDLFTTDGAHFYEVDYVTDNTHLTLKTAYQEAGVSEKSYSIVRNFTATMPADIAARTAELLGDFRRYIDTDMKSIHGKSAYELAIEKGYTGTLSEWLEDLKAAQEWTTLRDAQTVLRSDLTSAQGWQTANDPYVEILRSNSAMVHNSIARGKNLGTTITAAQSAAIQAGTFDDIWIGDFWTGEYTYSSGGQTYTQTVKWTVMECDYFWGATSVATSGTQRFYPRFFHHVAVMPDRPLYTARIGPRASAGGYAGSEIRSTGLTRARDLITSVFGTHVVSHNVSLSTARKFESETGDWTNNTTAKNGYVTAIATYTVTVELPVVLMFTTMMGQVPRGSDTDTPYAPESMYSGPRPFALVLRKRDWCPTTGVTNLTGFWTQNPGAIPGTWLCMSGGAKTALTFMTDAVGISPYFVLN